MTLIENLTIKVVLIVKKFLTINRVISADLILKHRCIWEARYGSEYGECLCGSMLADTDDSSVATCWLDGRAASVAADEIVDDASRDSGICLMDTTTSAGDDAYQRDFSVLLYPVYTMKLARRAVSSSARRASFIV